MLDGSPTPSKTRFERLCKEMGLTRCAFAERLGIPRSSYFHLMTEAANPSLEYIELMPSAPASSRSPSWARSAKTHAISVSGRAKSSRLNRKFVWSMSNILDFDTQVW
jgi:transcriptional regulator with XRE-family HTH domain